MGEVRSLERNVFPLEFGNIELTPAQSPFQSEILGGGPWQWGQRQGDSPHGLLYLCPPQ